MYTELVTYVAKKTADVVFSGVADALDSDPAALIPDVEDRLCKHLTMVNNWSNRYTTVGLGVPKYVDTETIDLALHTTPRRYRGTAQTPGQITEASMLLGTDSYVILGDPGSGKTTTLKRIARHLLCMEPKSDDDFLQYPILVELRSFRAGESLFDRLSDIFALPVERVFVPSTPPRTSVDDEKKRRSPKGKHSGGGRHELRVKNRRVSEVLAELLCETKAALLIDGLDELSYDTRDAIEQELEELVLQLSTCKTFLTCRTGDYRKRIASFNVTEILPLDQKQIEAIAHLWLDDVSGFLAALAATPYSDIVDRPLILTFLLYLYSNTGELPARPALIYRQVVYRLLKEWDENRGIVRRSKYSHFDPDRKIDFLSELSYLLSYDIKSKSFDQSQFALLYDRMKDAYGLPPNEADLVAAEIETHTGLLFASGLGRVEFSHLSLQEYLCANYLVTSPYPDLLSEYFREYPAPVAVACSLSSDPSKFFAEIVKRNLLQEFRDNPYGDNLDPSGQLKFSFEGGELKSFLARLRLENPTFRVNEDFGFTVLCLFAVDRQAHCNPALLEFVRMPGVLRSVRKALQSSQIEGYRVENNVVVFSNDRWFASLYFEVRPPWQLMAVQLAQLNPKFIGDHLRKVEKQMEDRKELRRERGPAMERPDFPLVLFPANLANQLDGVRIFELSPKSDLASRLMEYNAAARKRRRREGP
jgi:DNA polymerase III delta prime subunit